VAGGVATANDARWSTASLKFKDVVKVVTEMLFDLLNPDRAHQRDKPLPKRNPTRRLLALVWPAMVAPSALSAEGAGGKQEGGVPLRSTEGRAQVLWLVALSLLRLTLVTRSTNLTRQITTAIFEKNFGLFRNRLGAGLLLTAAGSACVSGINYQKASLVVQWRAKITMAVHDSYFSTMAYYHIANLQGRDAVGDADERLSREVQKVCVNLTNQVGSIIQSVPAIVWYTVQMYRSSGGSLALSALPHLYLVAAYEATSRLLPKDIGQRLTKQAVVTGDFAKAGMSFPAGSFLHLL
jgi:hypothetical protein